MEKGVGRDYKLKEGLIVKQQIELTKVTAQITELRRIDNKLAPKIITLQEAGEQSLDNEAL